MSSAVELAVQGSFLLVPVVGGMRGGGGGRGGGADSPGDLVAFLPYASYLFMPLSSVFRAIGLIQRGWRRRTSASPKSPNGRFRAGRP